MARYFFISNGPRGCYMPDNGYHIKCDTRRELKKALESEAYYLRDAGFIGASKKNIASLAAQAWCEYGKDKPSYLNMVCPLQPSHVSRGNYCYGLFVSVSCRADYLENCGAETESAYGDPEDEKQ